MTTSIERRAPMGTWLPRTIDGLNESAWRVLSKLAQNQQATKTTMVKDLLNGQGVNLEEIKHLENRGLIILSISGLDMKMAKANHPRLLDIRLTTSGMRKALQPHALVLRVLAGQRRGRLARFVREETDASNDDLLNMGASGFITGAGPDGDVPLYELREIPSNLLLRTTRHGLHFTPR